MTKVYDFYTEFDYEYDLWIDENSIGYLTEEDLAGLAKELDKE